MSKRLVGHIEKRGPNKYRLTASGGFDSNGKRIRHRRTVTAKNDKEAEKLLAQFITELEGGDYYEPSKLTVKGFIEKWLLEYAEANLAPKTLYRYREIINSRIIPALGHLTLDRIKPLHIVEFENSLRKDGARLDGKPGGLSERTILHHHRILCIIFNTAVTWGVLKESPVARVKAPRVPRKQAKAYTEEQTAAMLAALESEPLKYRVMVHLALATGLRRGELMGLEWRDIDFEAGTLDVRRASQYLKGKGVFTKDPKTEESKRLVSLPALTLHLLKTYKTEWLKGRLQVGDLWQGSDRLFVTWDGQPMHPDTASNWFSAFLKRHNLPHIGFHGLRHTSATLLIRQGVDVRAVSSRLGHSRTSTTLDVYVHALRSADKAAAEVMNDIVGSNLGDSLGTNRAKSGPK
jgi:integrase